MNYDNRQYQIESYSIWGTHPRDSYKICIRYEIENLANLKIEALSWRDIGLPFVTVSPKRRLDWIKESSPPNPAIEARSQVRAFENSSTSVRTFLPSQPKHALALPIGDSVKMHSLDLAATMPNSVMALQQAGTAAREVTAVVLDSNSTGSLQLGSQFRNGDTYFNHQALLIRKSDAAVIQDTIKFLSMPPDIEISAPYLFASGSLKKAAEEDDAVKFIKRASEFRGQWRKVSDGFFDKTAVIPIEENEKFPAAYLIHHPVSIRHRGEVTCVMVNSYSFFPVPLGHEFCARE